MKIKQLSTRMTIYFSLVIIIAIICIYLSISQTFSGKLITEMSMTVKQKLDLISTTLDNETSQIQTLQFSLINDVNINHLIKQQFETGNLSQSDKESLQTLLDNHQQRFSLVDSTFAIGNDKDILNPLYENAPFNWIVNNNLDFEYFLKSHMLNRFSSPSSFPQELSEPNEAGKNTITYFAEYYDYNNYQLIGYLAINVNHNILFADAGKLCKSTFDNSYVVDEHNQIIFSSGNALTSSNVAKIDYSTPNGKIIYVGGKSFLFYSKTLNSYPRWRIVGLVSYQQITSTISTLYRVIFFISLAVLFLVVLASFYISRKITNPIRALSHSMALLGKGRWPEKIPSYTKDEINDLVCGFNDMAENIKNLTQEIQKKQEEQKKYEISLLKFQLELLQSQINPHFIHNTLNTMTYLAQKAGASELADIITSFNSMLRMSITQNNSFITVTEEIANLQNYMKIQTLRYDIPLEFVCEVQPEARLALLPKMILQPLVENALFHGIVPKKGGAIRVFVEKRADRIYLSVSDNGVGISKKKLNEILNNKIPDPRGYSEIGLSNVNERLSLFFGQESKLQISSIPLSGTQIEFDIPFSE